MTLTEHEQAIVKEFEEKFSGSIVVSWGYEECRCGTDDCECTKNVQDWLSRTLFAHRKSVLEEAEAQVREAIHRYQASRGVCTNCAVDIIVYKVFESFTPQEGNTN